jgi:hypothetical protein
MTPGQLLIAEQYRVFMMTMIGWNLAQKRVLQE